MLHHVLVMAGQQVQLCPAAQLPAGLLRQRPVQRPVQRLVQRLVKEGLDASTSPAAAHWPRCPLGTAAVGHAAQL